MDVNKAHAISPVGSGGSRQERKRDPEDESPDNGTDAGGESGASALQRSEAFAIGGLLAGDLDPKVSQALEILAGQIEPLRTEVEHARGREAHFRSLSEKHSFLPLVGRREFLRELGHVLSHLEGANTPVLILLHLINGDEIRQRLGRTALDGVLTHVAAVFDSTLNPTDIAGNLDGNDFGLVLLAGDPSIAEDRTRRLRDGVTRQPFLWQSNSVSLQVATGFALLNDNMTPESAMLAADRDLLQSIAKAAQSATDRQTGNQSGGEGSQGG